MAIVALEDFLAALGVAEDDTEAVADATRLHASIDAEIKRLAHRDFEGDEGGSYDEVIRIAGAAEFVLPHVPVDELTSVARVYFDSTEDDPYETTDYRLESSSRGLVALRPGCSSRDHLEDHRPHRAEYVRVVWTTTGAIPAQIPDAFMTWGKDRWAWRDQVANLAGYQTGQDAETYFEKLVGRPPREVLLQILGVAHVGRGGKV